MTTTTSSSDLVDPAPRRRGRMAISLRALMLAVLALGLWLGWRVHLARVQREAVAVIKAAGGQVAFDWEFAPDGRRIGGGPNAPDWLVKAMGAEYFQSVVGVELIKVGEDGMPVESGVNTSQLANALRELPKLKSLTLMGTQAADPVMQAIGALRDLETLDIITFFNWTPKLTDTGIAHLAGLKRLKKLQLMNAGLSDASLAPIGTLRQLESLSVQGSNLTDSGIAHLKPLSGLTVLFVDMSHSKWTDAALSNFLGMMKLQDLGLQGTAVTDEGLMSLRHLTQLDSVFVSGSAVTEEGKRRFQACMPKLTTLQ
jgi:hypothetical protein